MRIKRKRSRRVSFADTEITSVHIFNRDEDSDNPPDSEPQSSSQNDSAEPVKGVVGFFKDLGGESDDFKDSDDEDDGRKSFLRPLGSPSPGSSIPGSATSNDGKLISYFFLLIKFCKLVKLFSRENYTHLGEVCSQEDAMT